MLSLTENTIVAVILLAHCVCEYTRLVIPLPWRSNAEEILKSHYTVMCAFLSSEEIWAE